MKKKIIRNFNLKVIYASSIFFFVLVLIVYLSNIITLVRLSNYTKTIGIYYQGTITYTTRTNNVYNVINTMNIFEDNEEIILYYNNSNEEKYITKKELLIDFNPGVLLFPTILLVIMIYIINPLKKDEKYLIENGEIIKCKIISIDNYKDKFWGPYTIISSRYEDNINNITLLFNSDKIFSRKLRNTSFAKGTAYVYYMKPHPEIHIMTEYELDSSNKLG